MPTHKLAIRRNKTKWHKNHGHILRAIWDALSMYVNRLMTARLKRTRQIDAQSTWNENSQALHVYPGDLQLNELYGNVLTHRSWVIQRIQMIWGEIASHISQCGKIVQELKFVSFGTHHDTQRIAQLSCTNRQNPACINSLFLKVKKWRFGSQFHRSWLELTIYQMFGLLITISAFLLHF